jgi:hypothetical protein
MGVYPLLAIAVVFLLIMVGSEANRSYYRWKEMERQRTKAMKRSRSQGMRRKYPANKPPKEMDKA